MPRYKTLFAASIFLAGANLLIACGEDLPMLVEVEPNSNELTYTTLNKASEACSDTSSKHTTTFRKNTGYKTVSASNSFTAKGGGSDAETCTILDIQCIQDMVLYCGGGVVCEGVTCWCEEC